jgi:ABC-type long-subunit fatty acid transport system fused permease/ATPase subunit
MHQEKYCFWLSQISSWHELTANGDHDHYSTYTARNGHAYENNYFIVSYHDMSYPDLRYWYLQAQRILTSLLLASNISLTTFTLSTSKATGNALCAISNGLGCARSSVADGVLDDMSVWEFKKWHGAIDVEWSRG